MNTLRRRFEKEKKRERARRVERRRRLDADRRGELMMQAEIASARGDLEGCLELLEKVLRIRPHFADALEWAAQICFQRERSREGLDYYERLREGPSWPPLTFLAAMAAWKLGRTSQCEQWLAEFLSDTGRRKKFPAIWKAARSLSMDVQRASKLSRSNADLAFPRQEHLFKPAQARAGEKPATPSSTASPASAERPAPKVELPCFPKLAVPEIEVRFEFEG